MVMGTLPLPCLQIAVCFVFNDFFACLAFFARGILRKTETYKIIWLAMRLL